MSETAPPPGSAGVPLRQLVIGIGNPLRGDDGIGWRLVEELTEERTEERTRNAAGMTTGLRTLHQLTPELAPELAACDRALFIDAWVGPPAAGRPSLRSLAIATTGESSGESPFSHHLDPAQLLAMATTLFGSCPRSDALLVPAYEFGHGTALSDRLRSQLPIARRLLRHWLEASHA